MHRRRMVCQTNPPRHRPGEKLGRPRVAEKVEKAVLRELEKGRGIHTVARAVGIGTGTVQRIMKRSAVA